MCIRDRPRHSFLSPYLHFGHISPLRIALDAGRSDAFLEEVIVRREAARNFCFYRPTDYDGFGCVPTWAAESLHDREDERGHPFSEAQFRRGETDDAWPHDAQADMARRLNTEIVILPSAAHSPGVEAPEELVDEWKDFLLAH